MNDDELNRLLSRKLEQWNEPLSPGVQGRLRAARRTALQTSGHKFAGKHLLAAMSLGCMAVVTVITLQIHTEPTTAAPVDDMYMLTLGDDFELYDDVEFMLWLGEQPGLEIDQADV